MKQIKVLTEIRKEIFEQELAKYMSNGFNILQSNITFTDYPLVSKEKTGIEMTIQKALNNTVDAVFNSKDIKELSSLNYHIVYYAILMKED